MVPAGQLCHRQCQRTDDGFSGVRVRERIRQRSRLGCVEPHSGEETLQLEIWKFRSVPVLSQQTTTTRQQIFQLYWCRAKLFVTKIAKISDHSDKRKFQSPLSLLLRFRL